MRSLYQFERIFLYVGKIDFRRSIDGLAALVQSVLRLNPFEPALFVFMNRQRDRAKILYWDKTGFALWIKRLEKDKFPGPRPGASAALSLTPHELDLILSGVDIWVTKPHAELYFSTSE